MSPSYFDILYDSMISPQARIIKRIIKAGNKRPSHNVSINEQRRSFERTMRILFPTLSSQYITHDKIADVPVEWIAPRRSAQRTIIYVHGGAFALGSSRAYRQHMVRLARLSNAKVLSIDYSLAPEYPYPHAVNQVYNVWKKITLNQKHNPSNIAFVGDSAGANLILAAILKARDESLPLPACLVFLSAGLDATFDGESYKQNEHIDPLFTKEALDFFMKTYVQEQDKKDPLISPVFADLKKLPPMLIHVGSDEMLLSTSQKIYHNAKRDGVDADLFIGEGMWHNWHLFAGFVPEARMAMKSVSEYVVSHTKEE